MWHVLSNLYIDMNYMEFIRTLEHQNSTLCKCLCKCYVPSVARYYALFNVMCKDCNPKVYISQGSVLPFHIYISLFIIFCRAKVIRVKYSHVKNDIHFFLDSTQFKVMNDCLKEVPNKLIILTENFKSDMDWM